MTVYYANPPSYPKTTAAPTEIGSYNVTFDVAAVAGWNVADNLAVGILVIKAAEEGQRPPVLADFIVDGLGVKDYLEGEVYYAIKVTVKDAADGNPLITPYYDGRSDVPGVKADAVGTHTVRFTVAAGGNFLSGDVYAGTITITQGEVINAGNISQYFNISGLSQVYDNTPKDVKIEKKYGYAFLQVSKIYTGISGTRYGPSSNAPSASGTYAVTFSVRGDNFKTVTDLPAGTLTIGAADASRGNLARSDFDIPNDNPWNTKYNLTKDVVISVNPKADKKADIGVVTVKYLRQNQLGDPSEVSPKDVGYYDVYVYVSESVKYNAYSFTAETLTINKADDPIQQWEMVTVGLGSFTYDGNQKPVDIYIPKFDYRAPANAVWYGGSGTAPTDVGEYDVTFDIILDGIWSGSSRNSAGKLNITPRGPALSDFEKADIIDTDKEYNDVAARVTLPSGASGVAPNNGTIGLNYRNKATGVFTPGAVKYAGTYELYLTLAGNDPNWLATDGDGIPLGQELTIRKRKAVHEDFALTPASKGLDQFAYAVTQPDFVRVQGRPEVDYPTTNNFRAVFYLNSAATTVTAPNVVNAMAGGELVVRINLTANLNDWEPGQLEWPFVVKDNTFISADEFVKWYNGLGRGNTVYEAKFRSGTGNEGIKTLADIKKIALAIKDVGEYTTAPNSKITHPDYWPTGTDDNPINPLFTTTDNTNKRLSLNLRGTSLAAAVNTLVSADNGFKDCLNLRAVDLSNVPDAVPPQTSPVVTINAETFNGCTNLETLKLGSGVVSLGATATASYISSLSNLKNLQLDGAVTPFTNDYLGETVSLDMLTLKALVFTVNKSFELSKVKGLTMTGAASFGTATDVFLNSKSLKTVVLPDTFDGRSIPAGTFKGCAGLTSVTFPSESWTGSSLIDDGAFEGCSLLQTVTLPKFPASGIDNNAFGDDKAVLTYLTLGQDFTVYTNAFTGKKSLREVTLNAKGSTITAIPAATGDLLGVFEGCTKLSTVRFPSDTSATPFIFIGNRAFKDCEQLGITLPGTLDSDTNSGIGISAFENCTNIKSVTIPSGIKFIQSRAFYNTGLVNLTIPQSVTKILQEGFAECKSLEKVTLANTGSSPTTLALLGEDAGGTNAGSSFAGCVKLRTFGPATGSRTGVTYPEAGVCEIPTATGNNFTARVDTFKDTAFNRVFINSQTGTVVNGNAFSVSTGKTSGITTLEFTGVAKSAGTGYDFGASPNNVPSVTKVIWDIDGMIVNNTFAGTSVERLVVTKAMTSTNVIAGTFPSPVSLKTLEVTKESQTTDSALFNIAGLTTVIIGTQPNGDAIDVGNDTNIFPTSVKTITFTGKVGTLGDKFSDNLIIGTGTSDSPYITLNFNGEGVIIPENGTVLGDTANKIQVVNLGAGVTNANTGVNFVSTELVAINVIGNNVRYANGVGGGDGVLYELTGSVRSTLLRYPAKKVLAEPKAYTIHQDVRTIGTSAFSGNTNMVTLTIPEGVNNIGSNAFSAMNGLKTVNYNATNVTTGGAVFPAGVQFVNIGDRVQVIPALFLGSNTGIGDTAGGNGAGVFTVPASVTTIGSGAFSSAATIREVRFYATDLLLTSTAAFSGLDKITKVDIGSGVRIIPEDTFKGTSIVTGVSLGVVEHIGAGAFENCTKLTDIVIPATCTFIGNTAFAETTSLTNVRILGARTEIADVTSFREKGDGDYVDIRTEYAGGAKPGLYTWEVIDDDNYGWLYWPGL